jgi:hypothetical protein
MAITRRSFLYGAALGSAAYALRPRRARAASAFQAKHVVVLGIGGGLRMRESLGMGDGATMPNLFGTIPLVSGFGASPAGPVKFAPEYLATRTHPVVPAPLAVPLYTQGALITNLRYAEGSPGHLQGHACLVSGAYNDIENRADAHAPAPTLFELHRYATHAPATDAWYVSMVGGFYRTLLCSGHPEFGASYGGAYLSPPGAITELLPIVASGKRSIKLAAGADLPTLRNDPAEASAVQRLVGVLDQRTPPWSDDAFRAKPEENAQIREHLASVYSDKTYNAYYPQSIGIGAAGPDNRTRRTLDALTIYHAERVLTRFKPSVMAISLLDIDDCHDDYNGYLRGQVVADALARHLWEHIQTTDGLKNQTALIIMPEHGRHLFHNGQNTDSLGRSGIDHGQGDDGDRNVWMLALGPDFKPGTIVERTNVTQEGRASGRFESIDATYTAASLLGYGDLMKQGLASLKKRPGLLVEDILR